MRQTFSLALVLVITACGHNSTGDTPDACSDKDGDGQTDCAGDCNDNDPTIMLGGAEVCGDGKDNNCDGNIDENCNGLGTWVSELAGADTNPGTQTMPVATIGKAVANATTIGNGQDVYVSAGHYTEKLTMIEGMDLLGGYACASLPCAWTRDPAVNDTAVFDTDFEGVYAPDTVTRATKLDGFRVMGMAGTSNVAPGGSAITVVGSPTISNNRVFGGALQGGNPGTGLSSGIAVLAPSSAGGALIIGNDITVGTATNDAAGIAFTARVFPVPSPSFAEVRANKIHGGTARNATGILAWSSGPGTIIANNDIVSGTSNATGGAWGIRGGGKMMIDGNRINVPPAVTGTCLATDFCGGIQSESSISTITNNVVFGAATQRSAAVRLREVEVAAGVVILNSNYLDGGGLGASPGGNQTASAAVELEYTGCGACGVNAIMGRIRNNILVGGNNSLRFGVLEADSTNGRTNRPEALENNDFWLPPTSSATNILYHQWNGAMGANLTTLAQVNAITRPAAANNLNADPLVDATYHLTLGSPCIDASTATEVPTNDMDGNTRPNGAGPDIGADEM